MCTCAEAVSRRGPVVPTMRGPRADQLPSQVKRVLGDTYAPLFDGCKTGPNDWHDLFSGLAWSAFISLVGIALYISLSVFMMCCSFKSVSHPMRGFARGWMSAGALFMLLLTLSHTVQLRSFLSAMRTWNAEAGIGLNVSLVGAASWFGYLSALGFFLLQLSLLRWTDSHVAVYETTLPPTGPQEGSYNRI